MKEQNIINTRSCVLRNARFRDESNSETEVSKSNSKTTSLQMVDFETSNSKSEVSKSNSCKTNSFSKTMALQREPFLTMFYTTNLSPLLVTKYGFMIIIILSNYQ